MYDKTDRSTCMLCLAETWHDTNCVSFNRLRAANYQIVEHPRPRTSPDLFTNRGSVTVVSAPGINLSPVNVTDELKASSVYQPATWPDGTDNNGSCIRV